MNLEQQRALALARARRRRAEAYTVESQESRDARASASQKSREFFGEASKQPPLERKPSASVIDRGALGASTQAGGDVISFGFGDELFGALMTPVEAAMGAYSGEDEGKGILDRVGDAYARGRDKSRALTEEAREDHPVAATIGSIGGGLALAPLVTRAAGTAAVGPGTLARVGAGIKEGAVFGGGYGFGSGEGLEDSVTDAVGGAVMGSVIGGSIPAISGTARAVTRPVRDALAARRDPSGYAARKVQERLGASGMSVQQAANRMEAAPGANLADVSGAPSRDLLRTTTNLPGPARDRVTKQLNLRQIGQGSRVKDSVGRHLADTDSYLGTKEALARKASEDAAPLYREAYAQPVPYTVELESIIQTPAGRRALAKATELAENDRFPFRQLFARELDDGSFEIQRVPDMRGWDYIKRGFDDMIDGQTDALTKKVTNEGRIITRLKNDLLSHLDAASPTYAQARAAYAGPRSIDEAMEFGRKTHTMSPDAVRRGMATLSPTQRQAARIGRAEELRKAVDAAGFTNNAVPRIMGNRQQLQTLRAMFDDNASFNAFTRDLIGEARKRLTYDAVKGNSSTVRQAADMAEAGGLDETIGAVATAATTGPVNATLQWIGGRLRRLGGLTPKVADEIARRLTSANPQAVRGIVMELRKLERAALGAEQRRAAIQGIVTRAVGVPAVTAGSSGSR